MSNMSEDIWYAGSDTRPPMLDRTDFESWQQRIRLYCLGKDNGENIMKSITEGPFQMGTFIQTPAEDAKETEGALQLGPERARVFTNLSAEEKERYKADIRATNILLQGETIHVYYVRFSKLINDMRNIKMTMSRMQLNSKFVNNMLPEWSRFITEVKLNRDNNDRNKAETLVPKPLSALIGVPPNTPVKLVPRVLPTKSQVKINLYIKEAKGTIRRQIERLPLEVSVKTKGTSISKHTEREVHQKVQQTNDPVDSFYRIWKPNGKLSDNSLNKTKQIWKPKGKLSDNSLNKTKQVWKATGKLFANVGYQWRSTGKKVALGKLNCGYQWRPTGKKFAISVNCAVVQIILRYLDSGCSKLDLEEGMAPDYAMSTNKLMPCRSCRDVRIVEKIRLECFSFLEIDLVSWSLKKAQKHSISTTRRNTLQCLDAVLKSFG
ncbi:hypothetical protein Tco_1577689 [Tanacetum coccineum]